MLLEVGTKNKVKLSREKQNKAMVTEGKERQCEAGQGRAGRGKARYGKTRYEKASLEKGREGKESKAKQSEEKQGKARQGNVKNQLTTDNICDVADHFIKLAVIPNKKHILPTNFIQNCLIFCLLSVWSDCYNHQTDTFTLKNKNSNRPHLLCVKKLISLSDL